MKNMYLLKGLSIIIIFFVIFNILCIGMPKVQAATSYTQTLKSGLDAFPESYKILLKKFIEENDHTNWSFQAYYTGIDWNDFINAQSAHGKNRIHRSYDTAYRCSCNNLASGYYCADKNITAYFIDPRNFINERNIFQFLEISYNKKLYTKSIVEEMIKKYKVFNYGNKITFKMSDENHKDYGKDVTMTFADIIMVAAEKSQMSPISIVTKIIQEVGSSGSGSTTGTNKTYPSCYNYFNIGAYDTGDAILNGLKYANNAGWHCPYTSIIEGAEYNSKNYIKQGQNTLYFYKFDCVGNRILKAGETATVTPYNLYHQYMTNVYDPYSQSATYFSTYTNYNLLDKPLNFIIPVYDNMPNYVGKPSTLLNDKSNDLYYANVSSSLLTRVGPGFDKWTTGNVLYRHDLVAMLERKVKDSKGNEWDKVKFWNGNIIYVLSEYLEKYTGNINAVMSTPTPTPKPTSKPSTTPTPTATLTVKPTATPTLISKPSTSTESPVTKSDKIKVENKNITLLPDVTADIIAKELKVDKYTVKNGDKVVTDKKIGTGYKFIANNKEYILVKLGDVNGDTDVDLIDLMLVKRYLTKQVKFDTVYKKAGKLQKDEADVDLIDLMLLKRHLVGTEKIVV